MLTSLSADPVRFAAPWGRLLWVTSTTLVCFLIGVSLTGWAFLPQRAPELSRWILLIVGPLILLGSMPFVVRGYEVIPGMVLVRRLFWTTRISLMGIKGVEANPQAMKRALRLLGNGGAFVFAGLFRSRDLGMFRAYVNDFRRSVVLRFPARTIVVSPDDPAAFVQAIKAQHLFTDEAPR
jgi:hypothetical protein